MPSQEYRPEVKGNLVLDLRAIGIATKQESFAILVSKLERAEGGITEGDLLLLERRKPKLGEVVANEKEPMRITRAIGEDEVAAVVVGLIRKL